MSKTCKYGDPLCPCRDGDICHYQGDGAMQTPVESILDRPLANRPRLFREEFNELAYIVLALQNRIDELERKDH